MHKTFNLILYLVAFVVIVITGFRNYYLPFNHDEAATFFHFIQKSNFLPYQTDPDANNHILNSLLSFISFKFFGDSPFALRLPNLLSLFILLIAIFRINKHIKDVIPQIVLFAGFILSFHWLSFFNISRGYGISMAFLLLAIAFFIDYLKNHKVKYLVLLFLFIQLAISANLTLTITALLLSLITWYHQTRNNLFNIKNIIVSIVHIAGLWYWISYSFYLKENNALYYGSGTDYFNSTFFSLVELLSGYSSQIFTTLVIIISAILLLFTIYRSYRSISINKIFTNYAFTFSFITLFLVVAFYLLNIIAEINFPEDRTALFIYVFAILFIVFLLDSYNNRITNISGVVIITLFTVHFLSQLNFSRHSVKMYATMPHSFYNLLAEEQKKNTNKFTIGGYRMSELSFNFMNYRNGGILNLMDPYEEIELHYDYIVGNKKDSLKYLNYYNEISFDKNHSFVLLKRKIFKERTLIYSSENEIHVEGDGEYFNFYEINNIVLNNKNSLIAEIDFTIEDGEHPLDAWIVFHGESKEGNFYERYPLSWLKYNWRGKNEKIHLVTSEIPQTFDKIIVYLWNIKKQPVKLTVHQTKIYQLAENTESKVAEKN